MYIFQLHRCFCTPFQMTVLSDLCLGGCTNAAELPRPANFNWNALESHSAHKMLLTTSVLKQPWERENVTFSFSEISIASGTWLSQEPYAMDVLTLRKAVLQLPCSPTQSSTCSVLSGSSRVIVPVMIPYVNQPFTEIFLPFVGALHQVSEWADTGVQCWPVEGGDCPTPLCTGVASPWVLAAVWGTKI